MGCGILYRMVAEQIGLRATLATRRTGRKEGYEVTQGVEYPGDKEADVAKLSYHHF